MSTSRPCSLKMPFSNAYHMTQSSALMLLYAATTFLQHGSGVAVAATEAVAAVVGVDDDVTGAEPPHAAARMPMIETKIASLDLICASQPFLRSDLWSPALETVLHPLKQPREDHARAGDEEHRREHLRRLER